MYISLQVNRENMKLYPMVPMERLAAQARIKISSTGKTLRNRNRQSLIFNRQSINGFTMVEMLVVLFLIGLMLSIAVPSFIHTVETLKFKATARKIVSTLRYARNTAVFLAYLSVETILRAVALNLRVSTVCIKEGTAIESISPMRNRTTSISTIVNPLID